MYPSCDGVYSVISNTLFRYHQEIRGLSQCALDTDFKEITICHISGCRTYHQRFS